MYCPSCEQTFGATFSRCPECHCWLKPSKAGTSTTTVPTKRGGSNFSERQSHKSLASGAGWGTPEVAPDRRAVSADPQDGWNHPSTLALDRSDGREHGIDEEDSSGEWIEEIIRDPDSSEFGDDWVDEELELYDEHPDTQYIRDRKSESEVSNAWQWMIMAVAGILLISGLALKLNGAPDRSSESQAESVQSEARESATIWMSSAQESIATKDYELATAQLERVVGFLREADAPKTEISATKTELGHVLVLQGRLEKAYSVLDEINDPKLKSELNQIRKDLRVRAEGLQKKADSSLAQGQYDQALSQAKQSSALLDRYGGQPYQRANSKELIARAYRAKGNTAAAWASFKEANNIEPNTRRQIALDEAAPRGAAPPLPVSQVTVSVKPPTFLEPSDIPAGVKTGGSNSHNNPAPPPPSDATTPPPSRPPQNPVALPPSSQSSNPTWLGDKDVFDGYKTKRPQTLKQ